MLFPNFHVFYVNLHEHVDFVPCNVTLTSFGVSCMYESGTADPL